MRYHGRVPNPAVGPGSRGRTVVCAAEIQVMYMYIFGIVDMNRRKKVSFPFFRCWIFCYFPGWPAEAKISQIHM